MTINQEYFAILRTFNLENASDWLQKYPPENLVVLEPKGEKDWKGMVVKTQSEVDSSEFCESVAGTVEEVLQCLRRGE